MMIGTAVLLALNIQALASVRELIHIRDHSKSEYSRYRAARCLLNLAGYPDDPPELRSIPPEEWPAPSSRSLARLGPGGV